MLRGCTRPSGDIHCHHSFHSSFFLPIFREAAKKVYYEGGGRRGSSTKKKKELFLMFVNLKPFFGPLRREGRGGDEGLSGLSIKKGIFLRLSLGKASN